jgi:hypothetical protein
VEGDKAPVVPLASPGEEFERVTQPPGGTTTVSELFSWPERAPTTIIPAPTTPLEPEQLVDPSWRSPEALKVCSEIIWESILDPVFRKITPPRRKWKMLEHPTPELEFEKLLGRKIPSTDFEYPIPIVLEKCIIKPIMMQAKFVN